MNSRELKSCFDAMFASDEGVNILDELAELGEKYLEQIKAQAEGDKQ